MTTSMYDITVPRFTRMMNNLAGILEKAQEHCKAKNIDDSVFAGSRIIADMFPLSKQIQIVTDYSKGCVARLSGQTAPVFQDNETTLAQLIDRLRRGIDFVSSIKPEQINNSEDKQIVIEFPGMKFEFPGIEYALGFVTPNVYFHATTAYNILRANGVALGKGDFMGKS